MLRRQSKAPLLNARGLRLGIVAARYNARYVDAMLAAALETFSRAGGRPKIVRVPGSFEIPVAVAKLAASRKFDALIALGVILRGETAHADLIASAITYQLSATAVRTGVPVIHEVLLLANERQARARCLGNRHNRGAEAACTAMEMARLMKTLNR